METNATIDELRARIAALESGAHARTAAPRVRANGAARDDRSATGARRAAARPCERALTEEEAFRKIERVAARREQSSAGMLRKLEREGFSCEVARAATDRALRCGLIDDARFADVLVRSRLSQGKGRAGIARELAAEGIDPAAVETFAETDFGEGDEHERARAALAAHPPRSKNQREGAYRFLMRKGFSAHVSASVARQWSEEAR